LRGSEYWSKKSIGGCWWKYTVLSSIEKNEDWYCRNEKLELSLQPVSLKKNEGKEAGAEKSV